MDLKERDLEADSLTDRLTIVYMNVFGFGGV
jgi:hypothetical protein